jgi:hypothetical protein
MNMLAQEGNFRSRLKAAIPNISTYGEVYPGPLGYCTAADKVFSAYHPYTLGLTSVTKDLGDLLIMWISWNAGVMNIESMPMGCKSWRAP